MKRATYTPETLDPDLIRENFSRVRDEVAAAAAGPGASPGEVEILVATKYVTIEGMEALARPA